MMVFVAHTWAEVTGILQYYGIAFTPSRDGVILTSRPEDRMKIMGWLPDKHNCVLLGNWWIGDEGLIAEFAMRLGRTRTSARDLVHLT